jgi:hypothetical protein
MRVRTLTAGADFLVAEQPVRENPPLLLRRHERLRMLVACPVGTAGVPV